MNYTRLLKKKVSRDFLQLFIIGFFLLLFNVFLYKIFSVRSLSFGCFDDCANYMAGYFMLQGRELYSEIFYNHIMGIAWLSFFIQKIHPSINLYDLVLSHRQVIMMIAFVCDLVIIKRFKWGGVLFVIFYELSKFYVFGDRFLGESIVVYAAVYLLGLIWEKYVAHHTFSLFDYVLMGGFTWLIIVMREPYIPLAVALYLLLLASRSWSRNMTISLVVFLGLLLMVVLNTNISDFYFNDFTVNKGNAIQGEIESTNLLGVGVLRVFFYPLFIFLYGKMNVFRVFEIGMSCAFLLGIAYMGVKRLWKGIAVLLFVLGLANIRVTPPGTVYFEAYHMMVWFGMFLMATIILCFYLLKTKRILGVISLGALCIGWGIAVFSPSSYLYDKIDLQEQLLTNFGNVMNVGNVVRNISSPTDTLFLDGGEDMIYWVSSRYSPYKYSWYTSVMPTIPLYTIARIEMFRSNPPTFYYDFCSKEAPLHPSLPTFVRSSYQQLLANGKPSCLYVLKSKIPEISTEQWKKAEEGFYSLPYVGNRM